LIIKLLKVLVYGGLRNLPGALGKRFETKYLWSIRSIRIGGTQKRFVEALDNLQPGAICVDLGANVGTISQRLWDKGAYVHAFEPDPWAFEKLSERFVGHDRVVLHNAAIGVEDGEVTLIRDPGFREGREHFSQGSSTRQSLLWEEGKSDTFQIESVDIRRFLRELPGDVEIMKIDIEGAEVDVLEALLVAPELSLVRKMFVETHEPQMPELRERLKAIRNEVRNLKQPEVFLDWV